jgi:hypothetical protein
MSLDKNLMVLDETLFRQKVAFAVLDETSLDTNSLDEISLGTSTL